MLVPKLFTYRGTMTTLSGNLSSINLVKSKSLCDPKELAAVVRAKGRDGDVQIKTEASAPIEVTSPTYGGAEVMPADENDCLSVPDRNQIPVSTDGVRLFPMFDMAPATWSVDMPIQSLRTAVAEMAVSKAPYSVLSLRADAMLT